MNTIRVFLAAAILLVAQHVLAYDNVLVITIDTLRADYVGCYGSTKSKTPNLDALAVRGAMFKNTVSATPFTLPSHISILTGLLPPVHGVEDNGGFYLDKRVTTLAEIFKAQQMKTGAFVGAFPLDSRFGLDQGFDLYDDTYPMVNNVTEMSMPERKGGETVDHALQWLQGQTKNKWFAWVHLYDPHFPYDPPDEFRKMFPDDLYAGEVAYADSQVGRLLKFLHEQGLENKTLVVVTADHGESLGEHKEATHGIFAYESTLRVPLIISPVKPASVNSRVRLIDIAPTILDLQKLSFTGKIQGKSLLRFMKDPDAAPEDSYFESLSMYLNAQWAPLRGFYSQNFKYIQLPVPELYDLQQDPKETKNLCDDKQLCDRWAAKFEAFYKPYEQLAPASAAPIDAETAEQLRALGYVAGNSSGPSKKKEFTSSDDPKNLIPYHNRVDAALNYYNKGYDLKALEILEKIIDEKPDFSIAYMHASFIYSASGLPDKAVEVLQNAIKNGMDGPEIRGKLGVYLYESQKFDEAVKQLQIAVKQDPRDLDNWNYYGMSLTGAQNFKEAESVFEKAVLLSPSDGTTLGNFGTLYLSEGKLDLAIAKFEAAVAANPHMANAYNGLGVAYAKQKQWDEAVRNWSLAVKDNDQNFDSLLNLAYAYLQLNQKDKALEMFQRFEKNAPTSRYGNDVAKARAIIRQLQAQP